MDVLEAAFLALAAFAAGAVNAVAGGGSLISFPALVATGYEAKTANVTNTVALWPGYLGGSFGYRSELSAQHSRIVALVLPSVLGAIAGSAILLSTPGDAFEAIVPFLILFAVGLMVFQERLTEFATTHRLHSQGNDHVPWLLHAAAFLLAAYGAYFGAGLGIMTLAVLAVLLPDDLQRSNALKGILSLLINGVAVIYFVLFGPVEWGPALVMAGAALVGGNFGVRIARRLSVEWLRRAVIAFAVAVAIVLFARL
ncbi:MAG: sulfite exporter TauE/SafE family protein [bacterium]